MTTAPPETWLDPVCGMLVPADKPHRAEHGGRTYLFCGPRCRQRFSDDPEAFLPGRLEDPVCGMTPVANTPQRHLHERVTYLFCSDGCQQRFAANPQPYVIRRAERKAAASAPPVAAPADPAAAQSPTFPAGFYTCPMHPEVQSDKPGDCPDCGMALEAAGGAITAEADAAGSDELADMTRRFWQATAFTLPLMLLAMGGMLPIGPLADVPIGWRHLAEWALATPVCVFAARPFHLRAWRSLVSGRFNMFTLIGLGVTVTYAYSVLATLAPGLFPATAHAHGSGPAVYFEAAAVIVTLVLLGQVLELRARARASGALRGLLALAPAVARRISSDGREQDVPIAGVSVSDRIRLRPGERVAVDGIVIDGSSAIDESTLTGESTPVSKAVGDAVVAGTLNGSGSLVIEARSVGATTVLGRIVALTAAAQRSRAPIQRLADQASAWFVPIVLAFAAATFVTWLLAGTAPALPLALQNAVAVLIIACPCALGLATPMSIIVATARGAGLGVLFRDATALETLARVDVLVVDKTGTLTEGKPSLQTVETTGTFTRERVLAAAAALERASEHPLAAAIIAAAEQAGSLRPAATVSDFSARVGAGIVGIVDGERVLLGNADLLAADGIDVAPLASRSETLRAAGQTVLFCAIGGQLAGLLGVADRIRETTAAALTALRADGVDVVMLTGDHATTAATVAATLGITTWHAGMSPQQKHDHVAELKRRGHTVAMAGDGVNDAPALAVADVGIAMGTGTDIAMESAAVTLMRGDLRAIARARRLSRATLANIRQNLFFAFAYNAACLPVAAGVFYPLLGWLLGPMLAAAAMSVSSVSVIANALRLRHARL